MPLRVVAFNVVQVAACLYALRRGGGPERWVAAMMTAAAVLTALLPYHHGLTFHSVDEPQLVVDAALMIGLIGLAVRADRYWPLWVAALQVIAIAAHLVRAMDATIVPAVYNQAIGKLAYPMILLLVAGTWRHRRRGLAGMPEADWSPVRWH